MTITSTADDGNRQARIAEARRLRAVEGLSKRQIAERFGVSTGTLTTWLRGVQPPPWTKRPNAQDGQRERARELRRESWSVPEIAEELGVSRSTAYQWVRDIPLDAEARRVLFSRQHSSNAEHAKMMAEARWAEYRQERDDRHAAVSAAAAASVGSLAVDDVLRLGALIYWCEGTKSKPWNTSARVTFVNSDPGLIDLFLAFLDAAGVSKERIAFRVHIHESADVAAAASWWAARVGVSPEAFRRTSLKRHNPKTVRHNTGEEYRGCLVITVRRSRELYWMIEGWTTGVVAAARQAVADAHPGPEEDEAGMG